MILTVTLNPSVDISYRLDEFTLNTSMRCENTIKTPGGKGINVTKVLKQLDSDVIATGFLGGELGEFIKDKLDEMSIDNHFIFTNKPTRNCIAIITKDSQTEILESGYEQSRIDIDHFISRYEKLCTFVSCVCISGSVPRGVTSDDIEKLIMFADLHNTKVILDMSGDILYDVVNKFTYKPYVIKPNMDEFKALIKKDTIDIKSDMNKCFKDIDMVVLSCGRDGSYIKYKDDVYKADIPKVECVNPVGSGDAMVAGLAYAIENKLNYIDSIKIANACGISNCMSKITGYVDADEVEILKKQINVYKI